MSRSNGRTAPFPGFARGVPIVGQPRQELPKGQYFYQVPFLIRRDGRPLDAESFEFAFPTPLEGALFKGLADSIAAHLKEQAPDLSMPRVIVLQPIFLGFISQEQIDAAAARAEAEKLVIQ